MTKRSDHMWQVTIRECIQYSLTGACFRKISNKEVQFTEGGIQSAALLYKLLMAKTIIDTRATTCQFRSELSTLEAYMGTIGFNIEIFNLHVRNARMGLKARGQSADDLPHSVQGLSSRY